MKRMTILFADLLGVRSRWREGGRALVAQAFQDFQAFVNHAITGYSTQEILSGGIETDSAAIVCAVPDIALQVGRKLFRYAFEQSATNRERRFWLRGSIVPYTGNGALRWSQPLSQAASSIHTIIYDPNLLDAIQVEKSGIKGMRLLVDSDLCTSDVLRSFKVQIGRRNFITLKRLRNSPYPSKVSTGYVDFCWMATEKEENMLRYSRLMAQKLRHSAHNPEEFIQAAATQVLFHECVAIMASIQTRLFFEAQKVAQRSNAMRVGLSDTPSACLHDGTAAHIGDVLLDGQRELGAIVTINPKFLYLSTPDNIHRKVRTGSERFMRLTKK